MRLGRLAVLASVATAATAATIAAGAGCGGSVRGAAASSAPDSGTPTSAVEAGDTFPDDDAGEDAADTLVESDYGLASSVSWDEDGGDTDPIDAAVEDASSEGDGG